MWMVCFLTFLGPFQSDDDDLLRVSLETLLTLEVTSASNAVSERDRQPSTITTINQDQIQMSGARTLMQVLNLYVPGFFLVEDQDDTIAGFRGIAPDNNSKVMFLLNGVPLNTEWFWGPPDSLINGIALDHIDHIDVIRGPGSVTLGQGALLGVVHVVTKTTDNKNHGLSASAGESGWKKIRFDHRIQADRWKAYAFYSAQEYEGQVLRPEGNSTRDSETLAGGKIYDQGNRLGRADQELGLFTLNWQDFNLQFLSVDQKRDMTHFRRDRNLYRQKLNAIRVEQKWAITDAFKIQVHGGLERDDYYLSSVSGLTLGGTRENRQALGLIGKGELNQWTYAVGADWNRYEMGRPNQDGNNFIANRLDADLRNANQDLHWVYPANIEVRSLFGEVFWNPSEQWEYFGGLRYDHHPFWGSEISPRLGGIHHHGNWHLRLSFQHGFRGANGVHYAGGFQGDGLLREPNFDLVSAATQGQHADLEPVTPEIADVFEAEFRWKIDSRNHLSFVAYQSRINHVIGFDSFDASTVSPFPATIGNDVQGDWNGFWYFQNTPGSLTSRGLELEFRFERKWLEGTASSAWTSLAQVDEQAHGSLYVTDASQGDHFNYYPELVNRLNLAVFPLKGLQLHFNLLQFSTWRSKNFKAPGSTYLTGAARYRLGPHWDIWLSATNLGNERNLYPFSEDPAASATDQRPGVPAFEKPSFWLGLNWNY
ncbi:MAG: TonB-dependent receptor plug domain-containing protein [Acidobacteria bacterium]|nr:TonB-dependent receptor plug domain-containing protein [Acidobacteriota bacterium]